MSYCVHCGVELDPTATACPLCGVPVRDPAQPVHHDLSKPFPTRREEVKPVSKREAALLITVLLLSISGACGFLNVFLRAAHIWSLYIIGAAAMLWFWFVPPLVEQKLPLALRMVLDIGAVALYVFLIALANGGMTWYLGLALPIILTGGAEVLFLSLILPGRSILSTTIFLLGAFGGFCFFLELYIDRFLSGVWTPGWSLILVAIALAMIVPLLIVRWVPSLREEARRRFHM